MHADQSEQYWQQLIQNEANASYISQYQLEPTIRATFAISHFVASNVTKYPKALLPVFKQCATDNSSLVCYQSRLAEQLASCHSEPEFYQKLRQFRQIELTKLALAEFCFKQPITEQIKQLSWLAEALIIEARDWLVNFYQPQWGLPFNADGKLMPLLIYGMGKLGGGELNFSSDIDLIFCYPENGETQGGRKSLANQQYFTRIAQKLIQALTQITQDGFVYRVDMRLRPFGESGPLVLTFSAMEDYYQEQGRDWERYAMVKARLLGKSDYHHELSQLLKPFVYRRYIDFSVIDSLRKMKQLLAKQALTFADEINVKLGNGGIRELEFIVQAWQLIRGGRAIELQTVSWFDALTQLVQLGVYTQETANSLKQAYCFLRRVENCLQALNDEQTQLLPKDKVAQKQLLLALNIATWSEFIEQLTQHQGFVSAEFRQLISEQHNDETPEQDDWQLVWFSPKADLRQTLLQSLVGANVDDTQLAEFAEHIETFKQHIKKRSIGQRGRQILDKLMPVLLSKLATIGQFTGNQGLFNLLERIASRTAYLELLYENQGALAQLLKLCNQSAWLAEHLAQYPILLDELLDPMLFSKPPELDQYQHELTEQIIKIPADDIETQMELLRHFKQAQQLRIAIADLVGVLPVTQVSDHLTALAQAITCQVLELAWQQLMPKYGVPTADGQAIEGKGFAIIGYGKLGGYELAYGSDLDLVFLHNTPAQQFTNGEKQISNSQFYSKLVQKMLHIFNTRMVSGILYELDMRLRPSGNSGVLVTSIDTFAEYQANEAWTWEHQALVRARCIYGDAQLQQQFEQVRKYQLTQPRETDKLLQDVQQMREKMRAHLDKSTAQIFDIKQGRGGLVDIEFLVQFWVLKYAHNHPDIAKYSDNIRILNQLKTAQLITEAQFQLFTSTYCYLRDLGHQLTLAKLPSHLIERVKIEHKQTAIDEIAKFWL